MLESTRMYQKFVRTISCVAGVLAISSQLHAQVLFQDDFELDPIGIAPTIGAWDGPHDPTVMYPTDRMAHSGRQSLELMYLPGSHGSSFMYSWVGAQDAVYVRWYQRWSTGFIWEPSATKMVILRPLAGYPEFYPEVLWANGQLAIQAQVTREANWDSENFYQNHGEPVVFGTDRWYCIEVFVKLNTPGVADGQIAAWIDGELKLEYFGREFRGALPTDPGPSTAQIQAVGLSGYYGGVTEVPQLQFAWQDDFVVSTQPIGDQFLSDDLETDTTDERGQISGWDGPAWPSVMHPTDRERHSGSRSLELTYVPGSSGAGYMYRHFPAREHVYLRWYQKWAPGFIWEPSGTGLMGIKSSSYGFPQFYPFTYGVDGTFAIQAQVVAEGGFNAENFLANRGGPPNFSADRWYCIEVYVKLNVPGAADGELAAWIDGEQKLFYTGRQFVGATAADPAPATAQIGSVLVTAQYGGVTPVPQLQYSWQDDFVGSSERIGCAAAPPDAIR
jgi:hypothetical protein